jgi:hypothetical protein
MPDHDEPTATSTQNGHVRDLDVPSAVEAEQALAEALYGYAGEWVAVKDHVVIDNASDLGTLVGRLNGQRATAEVFRVGENPETSYCQ